MNSVRERLETELAEAERELQELEKRMQRGTEFDLDEDGAATYSWQMALARRERVTVRIEALREALARVHAGTYGLCERCGAQIDPERLEILPTASLCADCARAGSAPPKPPSSTSTQVGGGPGGHPSSLQLSVMTY
jgi:DnaK suppressor protein